MSGANPSGDPADPRRFSPSALRNRDPVLAALSPVLAGASLVLEVASGTGEHVCHFAAAHPGVTFQPTDPMPEAVASVDAWVAMAGLSNVRPALLLNTTALSWPVPAADVVVCLNMIHIAPWPAAIGLIAGAARVLSPGGALFLYGPFRQNGAHTAPSNAEFDADLQARNPLWGVRDLEAVAALALAAGFGPPSVQPMPANNLAVVWRKE